jgi:hypothetical protein
MRRSGTGSGGGFGSSNVRHTSAPKVEPRARGINPSAVNELGNLVGDHATHSAKSTGYRGEPLIRGPGYNNPQGPTNMALSGPGAGRTLHGPSGSQGCHGTPNPGNPTPNPRHDALENE